MKSPFEKRERSELAVYIIEGVRDFSYQHVILGEERIQQMDQRVNKRYFEENFERGARQQHQFAEEDGYKGWV
ncbi:MAG: hypothetical protein M1835_008225 [Candelina submexicana]|nr:MAG: hypothetical protein M1835_008225 [Candelina submexicana]